MYITPGSYLILELAVNWVILLVGFFGVQEIKASTLSHSSDKKSKNETKITAILFW